MPLKSYLSKHARQRMQQRGINSLVLDLVLEFGSVVRNDSKSATLALPKKAVREVVGMFPEKRQLVDKAARVAAIVAPSGSLVLTVIHRRR